MTEYFTSFTMDYSSVLKDLKVCDIVEFNRLTYSHYAFHIGGGICIHVTGDEDTKSSGNVKKGRKCAMTLRSIANGSSCRINNLEAAHFWRGLGSFTVIKRRDEKDAIALALKNLPTDHEGNVRIGEAFDVPYMLMGQNCEAYSAFWRYEVPTSFSQQSYNPILGSTLGTGQRVLDEAAAGYMSIASNKDVNPVGRIAAIGASVPLKAAAITVGTAKAVADGATSVVTGVTEAVWSIFN